MKNTDLLGLERLKSYLLYHPTYKDLYRLDIWGTNDYYLVSGTITKITSYKSPYLSIFLEYTLGKHILHGHIGLPPLSLSNEFSIENFELLGEHNEENLIKYKTIYNV